MLRIHKCNQIHWGATTSTHQVAINPKSTHGRVVVRIDLNGKLLQLSALLVAVVAA
jgi:hypothetical protein